ncbi:hypothetical protein ACFUN7_18505 [Streptomyces sp. NPDC057236]|uniref:hypothetical protein n=1 Tax=Streptomyces sp. NPDC057236 TaxID=3346059 RepID=UPI0036440CA4
MHGRDDHRLPRAEVLRHRYRSRLPECLQELAGPVEGSLDLPLHIVWSGRTSYSLDRPKSRMTSYPLSGRFLVTDPDTGEECEADVLKEGVWAPPAQTPYGPVLSLDDVLGTKVRALADRGTVRDLVEVQAASRPRSTADLESLGRRRARDEFSLEGLRDRLIGADWYEDEDCTAYGLASRQIEELKAWALEWAEDLGARIHDENA